MPKATAHRRAAITARALTPPCRLTASTPTPLASALTPPRSSPSSTTRFWDSPALGSPWGAAIASFAAFAAGALVPLAPYLAGTGAHAFTLSLATSAVALFAIGMLLSLFTGRRAWYSGFRMLAIGAAAGGVTYALGRALGVAIG